MNFTENPIAKGRRLAIKAAQLLRLLRFPTRPGGQNFCSSLSTYSDMLNPESTDTQRLAACKSMLHAVRRRAEYERFIGEEQWNQADNLDPYKLELRTTKNGATLDLIAEILEDALTAFETANADH
ncbi:hypothetical protein [Roseovarius sp. D22-M7]|uniref:hypothetical protein n=1 Tax=Roseovarius sp. D22-M7 TaxID=3127116 RepID=UPI003010509B